MTGHTGALWSLEAPCHGASLVSLKPEASKTGGLHSFILSMRTESWTRKGDGTALARVWGIRGTSVQGAGASVKQKGESRAKRGERQHGVWAEWTE